MDVSYISNAHPAYIESLYQDYKKDPTSIDGEWKRFFEGFDLAVSLYSSEGASVSPDELKVWSLIQAYRMRGHLISKTNPIRERKDRKANLELHHFGLSEKHLSQTFLAGKELGLTEPTLGNILARLKKIYCGSIGFEYGYISNTEKYNWLKTRIEKDGGEVHLPLEKKKRILTKLNESAVLEKFLHTKYIGQKRFSLEGGESTIPALDAIIQKAAELGVQEIIIGMAHRGRLNVLANIMGKTYKQIFSEFEGNLPADLTMGDGDVKYHLGYSSQIKTLNDKIVHLKLVPNPSHLEAVNPVVEGFARAKADIVYGSDIDLIFPLLIHGDASLAGQGVVYETIQMSQLEGYTTGGTLHFVINNQIGFTTDFDDARSSNYCTSVAAVIEAPVFHVNGDDVEAVVYAVELATEYRQHFNTDVFVDMVCYRKYGHNEGDEPRFTQPKLYSIIANHPSPREIYVKKLVEAGSIEAELAKKMDKEFWKMLQDRLNEVKQQPLPYEYQEPELAWKSLRRSRPEDFEKSPDTYISKEVMDKVLNGIITYPPDFKPLQKVKKLLDQQRTMIEEGVLDWALGELLAYGSILLEGKDIRMSGQDIRRGTFSHRHAIIRDEDTSAPYNRLAHLDPQQGKFRIYNSLLSEFGVLGFEFGYSMASPNTLTIWEAQFGDFANGAQTIIDQFIAPSESKWQRMSGLVLLLPHGYEGQGPEHSSGRLERFLQLSAEFNMIVANCTTPANFFHLLRRQLAWPFRKPLVVMTPKSLLRHPKCVSPKEEFLKGGFREILDDTYADARKVKKVLLCSGKIYYDLQELQERDKRKDIAIIRLEQLYPLNYKTLDAITDKYHKAKFIWVQEEPSNMGAWVYMLSCYRKVPLDVISRKNSASPATGYQKVHFEEQQRIIEQAFA
ncbi:MAG: 2-oxoglutarate dehydrogenase subunit E1 [Chitinophagales bacterium]|nr:MAG: 2-oxoglutarate dehydrogenase subunit E1 [Chitinophagales bacterium]